MFDTLRKFWKKYGFTIIMIASIIALIICWWFKDENESSYFESGNSSNIRFLIPERQQTKPRGPKESKGEAICREVLERLFNRPFPNTRPDFLKNNETGRNLEIDCFNKDLGIAVEMQGIQHYKYSPWFHRTKQDFLDQQYRDRIKKQICENRGLIYIEVPYTIKNENIEKFIKMKLNEFGYNF